MRYYMNKKTWEVTANATQPKDSLPITPWTALGLAFALGGLFVVYLPALGLYMAARELGRFLGSVQARLTQRHY